MTIEEFESYLDGVGETLRDSDAILLGIVSPIIERMKQRAPYATGQLQQSIGAFVNDGTIKFNMLYYGTFQNYGVSGTEDDRGTPVPFGVDNRPSSGDVYQFQNRKYGLPRQEFFDIEQMTDYIVSEYENTLAEE